MDRFLIRFGLRSKKGRANEQYRSRSAAEIVNDIQDSTSTPGDPSGTNLFSVVDGNDCRLELGSTVEYAQIMPSTPSTEARKPTVRVMRDSVEVQHPEKNVVSVMYDDPYEESPLTPVSLPSVTANISLPLQQLQAQRQSSSHWHYSAMHNNTNNYGDKFVCAHLDTQSEDLHNGCFAPIDKDIEKHTKKAEHVAVTNFSGVNTRNDVLVSSAKFYQLSAEYGGIDDKDHTNNDHDDVDNDGDDDIGNYTELLEEFDGELLTKNLEVFSSGYKDAKLPPIATHCIVNHVQRRCEEAWDLSVSQRCNEEKPVFLQATAPVSSRDLPGDSVLGSFSKVSSCNPHDEVMNQSYHITALGLEDRCENMGTKTKESQVQMSTDLSVSFPVYGIPWSSKSKAAKQSVNAASKSHGIVNNYATSFSGHGINKVNVPVPVRSSSLRPVDSRPMEDYDEPWDQKQKLLCKRGTKKQAASFSLTHSATHLENSACPSWNCSLVDHIDTKLPLEKQPWYHAGISRSDAENVLHVHHEGSYLIRNSESSTKDYSLSVKSPHGFMHMKIVTKTDGCFVLGQFSQPFHSIAQMILHYTIHKLPIKGAEHMSLIFPVPKLSL